MDALESGAIKSQVETMQELRKTYGNFLDMDGSKLSAEFLSNAENLEKMKMAASGTGEEAEKAYNELERLAAEDLFIHVYFPNSPELQAQAMSVYDDLQSYFDNNQIRIGGFFVEGDLQSGIAAIDSLNKVINETAKSAEEAEQILMDAYGVDAEVEEIHVKEEDKDRYLNAIADVTYQSVPTAQAVGVGAGLLGGAASLVGGGMTQVPSIKYTLDPAEDTTNHEGTVPVFRIKNAHRASGGGVKFKHSNYGGGGAGKKSGGGGGSKTPKRTTQKPKEHIKNVAEKDRYHNIKEKIEDLNTEMERLNKNEDRAYGKDRVKYMDQMTDKIEDQIGLTKEYIKEIEAYAKTDKKALEQSLKEIGMSQREIANQFGPDGVLKDYEGLLDKIQKKFDATATASYNSAIDAYNRAVDAFNNGPQDDAAKESFDKAKETLDAAKETYDKQKEQYEQQLKNLKQYEDTINL